MKPRFYCNTFENAITWCIGMIALIAFKSFGQVDFPDPSPRQTVIQNFGMSHIMLSYSRPGVKGRKMIGNVEPFDSVWRAGANEPTIIYFKSPVSIGSQLIDSGKYVIYLVPRKNADWIFILNKGVKNWGSDNYKTKDDVLRVPIKIETNGVTTETLSYHFENVKPRSIDLLIQWENWQLTVPITANIKEKLRVQIEANLKSDKPIYWFAAQFYYEYEKDFTKALEMISIAIKRNEKGGLKPYWQYHYKAKILKDMDRKQEAIEAATLSSQMAKEHGNRNNYIKLNEELINSIK